MRSEMTLKAIVSELQRNCGDELAACHSVGVSLMFLNQWRKDDREVDAQVLEAGRVGAQGLVSAAIQRGVHGVKKGVYHKGAKVDEELVYSDSLLNTLLKAKIPEFAKDADGAGIQVNVNVANVMPRAENYEQWLAMKVQTQNRAALPAPNPDEAIDAEFAPVVASPFSGVEL